MKKVIPIVGTSLLVLGVVMGLAQGFIAYLPYSIYFGAVVAVLVGAGLYAIYKLDKTTHED